MKKTSIISVFLVFFIAIIIVGMFGDKIKIYDEEVEVEKIEWISTEYENNPAMYTVKKYTEKDKEKDPKITFDASLTVKIETGVTLNIKFICLPTHATHTELEFFNESKNGITRQDLGENTTSITFEKTNISTTLYAVTTDGMKTSYSIKINLISSTLFPGL